MRSPSLPLGNEDDFDWEAAVREIDTACDIASKQRAPNPDPNPNGKKRQSTLDRFVDSFTKRNKSCIRKNLNVDCGNFDNPGAEGGESAVEIDLVAAQTWIYPVNVPLRDYQFSIAKVALFSNTLVALPTGLGKTLIAAVVMYNYFRWFPEGKIVFTAPSRPLVMQQIEACHNIVGIPQEWAIDMTGQMSPLKRSSVWKTKRVFFVTPQVLEKDIQSGICCVKQIVCLVIDEAHRALGNYSYCVAVRELMTISIQLRILALTATPGSKQQTIQNVIDSLHISTLEYRNESDCDVSPYVHNRSLELIEVEMGTDAININNLLLEAMQPFVTRLFSFGVLYSRDAATLSPCELLTARDKFRQAPPSMLDQSKNKEVEGYFGVLLSLCHIRKLLTSHGVRPAYEMLDDKLRSSGPLAWLGSRNETIMQVKLLMQKSLSHGAPNPKLVKLIEILTEHLKAKDPKDSRVIIFSNFRGSVKDIMDSLSSIGDLVKATEFIGQSSGKALKGQTQKVQQAVLQKFRTGGYNVIVATCIGEEGLDIMEVDLVICFDANVSPLRMIQRMGRTGRKHDGRVVVLACEGSELKAYRKKLASSKAVRKHMYNGGIKSFTFHPSPRMVPHICKPQARFVELSIEQFIPRGKKLKDDSIRRSPVAEELLDKEKDLIEKYFNQAKEDIWKPSLIAFPSFQSFPSRVHELRHSFRTTTMLIDAMQHLQGLALSKANKASSVMEVVASHQCHELAAAEVANNLQASFNDTNAISQEQVPVIEEPEEPFKETLEAKYRHQIPSHPIQKLASHCFLFGQDFVTVDSLGHVFIALVPSLPYKNSADPRVVPLDDPKELFSNTVNDTRSSKAAELQDGELTAQANSVVEAQVVVEQKHFQSDGILKSESLKNGPQREDEVESVVLETPVSSQKHVKHEYSVAEATVNTENNLCGAAVFVSDGALNNKELSPRLTHFIEEGVVPESPIVNHDHSFKEEDVVSFKVTPILDRKGSSAKYQTTNAHIKEESIVLGSCSLKDELSKPLHAAPNIMKISGASFKGITNTDQRKMVNVQNYHCESRSKRSLMYSPINEAVRTPLGNSVNNSSSENWQQNSGETSSSSLPAPKYKRLRKYGDIAKTLSCQISKDKDNYSPPNTCGPNIRDKSTYIKHKKGKRVKAKKYGNSFIEVEAQVSQDAEVSEDEEDGEHEDRYDNSFIDDRANHTEVSTASIDAETCGDMMAFYRRSLLTQSPAECIPNCLATSQAQEKSFSSRAAETESCSSEKVWNNFQTPPNGLQSVNHRVDLERTAQECESSTKRYSSIESRKRKLSSQRNIGFTTRASFSLEDVAESEHSAEASQQQQPGSSTDIGANLVCDDDDFYRCLDFDALEEQATTLLKNKSSLEFPSNSVQINGNFNMDIIRSPSFDLGV